MAQLTPELNNLFTDLEIQYNLPKNLLKSVAETESGFNPTIVNKKSGASGMFQFMPETAKQYGVNVNDPVSSAQGAARMYADLLKQNGGDLSRALAGYNWGQGNVQRKGMENMPTETKNYIAKITGLMGNQTEQKKNSINIPPEAIEAFNSYQQQAQGQQMADNSNLDGIPPEALKAFESYQKTQAQAQTMSAPNGIPQEALEAFKAYQTQAQQPQVQPQPVQTPVQTQQAQQEISPFTIDNPQQAMNAQASQLPLKPQQDQGINIYNTIIDKANKGEDFTPVWNNLSPREKQYVGRLLQGEYKKGGNQTGTIERLWQGLVNSAQKANDSIEQIGNYINPVAGLTGNYRKNIDAKNAEIARNQAYREMNEAMDPAVERTIGEIGGDVAQFLTGEGIITAGASKAVPWLIVKGTGTGARAADLAVQGAGASIIQNPVVNAQKPEDTNFWGDKAKQAVTGAVLAPAIGLPVEKAVGAIGTQVNKWNQARKTDYSPEDQAFIQQAESQGIRWFPSDLPSANQDLIARSQKATFNNKTMNKEVTAQQAEVTKAVQDAQNSLKQADANNILRETGLDKVLKDTNNPYYYSAKQIEDKIANIAPDDPNAIMKYGAEAQLLSNKVKSRELYDNAEKLVPQGTKVELKTAEDVLNNAKKQLDDLATPSQRNQFKGVVDDLEATINKAKNGQNSYADINKYFREMGDNARQATRAGDANGARIYNEFKNALNKDKDNFMNSLPDSAAVQAYKKAYGEATNFNRENVQGIKNNNLSSIFEPFTKQGTPNLPDKMLEKWIKKGETQKVQAIYDALPQTSKDAVTSGVMNRIIKDAIDANGDIIPKKLISNYKAYEDKASGQTPLSVILEPSAKKTFDNLMATMGRLQNIGYNKANPLTGAQNTPVLKGVEAIGAIGTAKGTYGLSLIKPITNFIQNKAFVKGLTDPKFKKIS